MRRQSHATFEGIATQLMGAWQGRSQTPASLLCGRPQPSAARHATQRCEGQTGIALDVKA